MANNIVHLKKVTSRLYTGSVDEKLALENRNANLVTPVLALVSVFVMLCVVLIFFAGKSLQQNADTAARDVVKGILQAKLEEIDLTVGTNAWWNDAYENLSENFKTEWAVEYLDNQLPSQLGLSGAAALDANNAFLHVHFASDDMAVPPYILQNLARTAQEDNSVPPKSFSKLAVTKSGVPVAIGAARLVPEGAALEDGGKYKHVLVFIKPIAENLTGLGNRYAIQQLQFNAETVETSESMSRLVMRNSAGEKLGFFHWENSGVAAALARIVGLPMIMALPLLTLFLLLFLRRVEKTMREQDTLRMQAISANRAKSEFLAMMSHEIRTPMTGLLGMIDLAREKNADAETSGYLTVARQSGESLLMIINDILDVSKLEAGKLEISPIPFEPRKLARQVVDLFSGKAEEKKILLSFECDESVPEKLVADPDRWRQVLANLCGNALKFTHHGAVIVSISATPKDENSYVLEARVIDSGIGIPADILPRLFTRFSQADGTTARKFGGTGLGLAISRQLCTLMGGEITVESDVGKGSIFTARILAAGVAEKQDENVSETAVSHLVMPPPVADTPLRHMRILVAEDNPTIQMLLATKLRRDGHDVTIVGNGRLAVEMLESHAADYFECVLMDVQMPEMDGVTATKLLRVRQDALAQIHIVALTANAMSEDQENYQQAGFSAFVAKPINFAILNDVLRRFASLSSCPLDDTNQPKLASFSA